MSELHTYATWGVLLCALPTLIYLFFVSAPYGRHARAGWGPMVGPRLAWILMESPAVLAFGAVFATGPNARAVTPLVLLLVWQSHYVYRTFIFPFRLRGGRPMPLLVALSGLGFNLVNAYINAAWVSQLGDYPASWLLDPRFLAGLLIFVAGFFVNHHADAVLLALRKPGESGYKIPRGGLYRWVSCPNYLGEMMEWLGWAVMTWSLPGLAFFAFTVANLLPRALAHHRWYRAQFPDYPPGRRAVLPGIL